jgi:L-asparaginase
MTHRLQPQPQQRLPRVRVLHTGGTLAMRRDPGQPLSPDAFSSTLSESVRELSALAQFDTEILFSLDSSDIGPEHWSILAQNVALHRPDYDGFVIIHGTDTMPYTAAALAFALEGLDCPVIMTGAQRPLSEPRTDARRNLIDAIALAGQRTLCEVAICFDGLLLRGCRATKTNAHDYRAFDSPGCNPLARLGVSIEIAPHIRAPIMPFRPDPRFDPNVIAVQITPGLSPALLEATLSAPGLKGVVLAAFGAGTIPNTPGSPLAPLIRRAVDSGIDVVAVSQCVGGVDLPLYFNSKTLSDSGVIPGGHMRTEAAIPKLMHALAVYADPDARRRYLQWNVAGEMGG